ncbi:hypothetical protein [Spiroplasma endosymbiont of Cantharis rufa]
MRFNLFNSWRTSEISEKKFKEVLNTVGMSTMSQSSDIVLQIRNYML